MTYHQIYSTKKMTDATSGAGTAHSSGAPEFIPFFSGVHVAQSLVFWVVFCRPLYVFLVIILSVPLFGHYIVCLSLNFSFRLPLGYLQTHEEKSHMIVMCFNACRYFHVLIFLISCSKYRIWHLTNINKLTETENYRSSVRSNTL